MCPVRSVTYVSGPDLKRLVPAVGLEFSTQTLSPADSVALTSPLTHKIAHRGPVLWPRCGQVFFLGSRSFTPGADEQPRQMKGSAGNQGLARTTKNSGSAGAQPGPPIARLCLPVRPVTSQLLVTQRKRPATFPGSREPQFREQRSAH
jgi:hypothetical protein